MPVLAGTVLALALGVTCGFVMEKSRLSEPGVVVGQMQLRNLILAKVWFSAVATALICVTLLNELDLVRLHPKPVQVIADILGGLLFGVGMTVAGGSPAMAMAQIGAGYRDSWNTLVGGLAGALAFTVLEPSLRPLLFEDGPGPLTLADISIMPFPAWGTAIGVALFACIMTLERLRPWRQDLGADADGGSTMAPKRPPPA